MFFDFLKSPPSIFKIVIFVITILLSGGSFIFGLQQVTTMILTPFLFIFLFIFYRENPYSWSVEFSTFSLLLLSAFLSLPFSLDFSYGIEQIVQMFGSILIAYIVLSLNKEYDFFSVLFIAQIVSILLLIAYMFKQGNLDFMSFQEKGDRDRFLLPANTYNYFIFFANMSAFYLHYRFRNLITLILTIFLPLIFALVVLTIAARQGIILLVILNVTYWLFVLGGDRFYIRKILITCLLISMLIFGYNNYYKGSFLEMRTTNKMETGESRVELIKEGVRIFSDFPILGVGPGQTRFHSKFGLYTHNAYVEAAATQGIIGLILLLVLYIYPIYELFGMFKIAGIDKVYLKLNLLFYITFLINNMFRPFYLYPSLMLFYFVIISFQKNLRMRYSVD